MSASPLGAFAEGGCLLVVAADRVLSVSEDWLRRRPREWAVCLIADPWVVVIRDGNEVEAGVFGEHGVAREPGEGNSSLEPTTGL